MILRFRRARRITSADINVTAFMNLMVALVPFLLITLVFTQVAVQELNLPEGGAAKADKPPPQPLSVVVRTNGLTVMDGGGALRALPLVAGRYDIGALSELLAKVKERKPDEERIALLLEPDIAYDVLIQVMDAARYRPREVPPREMFPQISIGDAP